MLLPEMTNRQNSDGAGVLFRFDKVRLGRLLLRSDSYTRKSYWGMSNAYYPMKLIGFCMKYNNGFYLISSVHVCVLKCSDRNMLLCESYDQTFSLRVTFHWKPLSGAGSHYFPIYSRAICFCGAKCLPTDCCFSELLS